MTNYQKGANFERKVKADLIAKGWCAVRSAGSHGVLDILAHHKKFALYVQVKTDGAFPPKERRELMRLAKKHGAAPILAVKPARGDPIRYWLIDRKGESRAFEPVGLWEDE